MQLTVQQQGELTLAGVTFPEDAKVLTPPIRAAIQSGTFEAEEIRNLSMLLQDDDVVLDIGAGTGFSSLIAERCGVSKVIAVEANPALMPYIRRLLDANHAMHVTPVNCVLTNADVPEMTFYQRTDFWMGSLCDGPNPWVASVQVPTGSLNGMLRDNAVSVVMCDIEGAETVIFADADLSGVRMIQVEVHDHVTGLRGVARMIAALHKAGLFFDPRFSKDSTLVFHRVPEHETPRDYCAMVTP